MRLKTTNSGLDFSFTYIGKLNLLTLTVVTNLHVVYLLLTVEYQVGRVSFPYSHLPLEAGHGEDKA